MRFTYPEKLFISFSGGRTSAYMTKWLLENKPDSTEVVVIFANTGEENEATLDFVDNCDKAFNFNVVWVEAEVQDGLGKGTRHRVVDYETATRPNTEDGPFEQVIRKYGITNKAFPACTRELKLRPMTSYVRSLGWASGDYWTAIGIRADEIDRMSTSAESNKICYPLVKAGIKKQDIIDWWSEQPFDLRLPEHLGNCQWCWKKSRRKLLTLVMEDPTVFDFPHRMEKKYPFAGAGKTREPRKFFRGHTSTSNLFVEACLTDFEEFSDPNFNPPLDMTDGCGDSCEVFADEG